jgi:hypothetical protein
MAGCGATATLAAQRVGMTSGEWEGSRRPHRHSRVDNDRVVRTGGFKLHRVLWRPTGSGERSEDGGRC